MSSQVIYVMRNPKDVLVSLFHFMEMGGHLVGPGSMRDLLAKFLTGDVAYGFWFDHVRSWVNAEDESHILYNSYEDMSLDLKAVVRRTSMFLGKPLDDEVMEEITDRCVSKNMKKNNMSNYSTIKIMDQSKSPFLRKGIYGDWKNHLTDEEVQVFDAVYKSKTQDIKKQFIWDKELF